MKDKNLINAFEQCLDQTSEALTCGTFARLPALAGEMEVLAGRLARQGATLSGAEVKALRVRAERQLCRLAAARDGVRAAMERVAQLRRLSSELSTYDREGRGQTLRFGAQTLEHKA
jgi:hypothetical protein